ncbi:hypothetical protein ACUY29_12125 [Corynebacterium aurimucosum]
MGISPDKGDKVETNYRIDGSAEAQELINESEYTGNEAGKVFAEISAQADSANSGASELSKRVGAIERLPLLLWWDGTGTRPVLKPGWALYNVATGEVTF